MPDGATSNAQVANACLPAGQRPNKKPIFISGVSDTRAFLAWLRAYCPGGLMAQLKSERLMVVPSNADGLRAAVSALRSLYGKDGVSFHTFTLPEDRSARLLVKNLGRGMPESVAIPTPPRTALPPSTSLCQWRAGQRYPRCDHSPNSVACECRWSCTWLQKDRCNASAANASATRSATADTHLGVKLLGAPTSPVDALPRGISLCAVAAGETIQRATVAV